MADHYRDGSYGDKGVGFGSSPAVLVVDFQVGLTRPEYTTGRSEHIHRAVDNTVILLHEARALGLPVICCNLAWSTHREMAHWKIGAAYQGMLVGDPSTQIEPRIIDRERDYAFTKTAPSAFFNTPLITFLIRQRIDTLIVTGCTTSGCVRASINDSFSYGLRTIVAEECVGDMEEAAHHANLLDVGRRYADVLTLQQTLEALRSL